MSEVSSEKPELLEWPLSLPRDKTTQQHNKIYKILFPQSIAGQVFNLFWLRDNHIFCIPHLYLCSVAHLTFTDKKERQFSQSQCTSLNTAGISKKWIFHEANNYPYPPFSLDRKKCLLFYFTWTREFFIQRKHYFVWEVSFSLEAKLNCKRA